MIINEKRLARALKSSGAVGFRLRTVGGRMDLLGPGWAASLQLDAMDEPPKIVLAALVEMLGYVPGSGDCMSASKGKSGWSAQGMQDEVFETEFSTYFNRSYAERPCALLPLRLGAQQLVQTLDEHIYGIGPGWALRERNTAYVSYLQTGCVVLSDSESALAVRLSRPDEPGPIWTWLESRNWFDTEDGHGCGGAEA